MAKETFYFSHDYNARNDRKLVNVIMKHSMCGIGVYWCLVEMLYEEGGYLPTEYERISFELRTDTNVVQSVINDFDLFKTDADKFWSDAVLERLQERCDKSEKARESINKRWDKYKRNTTVIQSNEDRNTIKERKEKEKKEIFSLFWDNYHEITKLKKTDYAAAEKHWKRLTEKEKQKAIDNVQAYFDSLNDKKYCKKARTYLADKNFNDEYKVEKKTDTTDPRMISDIDAWKPIKQFADE